MKFTLALIEGSHFDKSFYVIQKGRGVLPPRFRFLQAGQQYEEENEKDFKEKKEYKTEKHYEYLISMSGFIVIKL